MARHRGPGCALLEWLRRYIKPQASDWSDTRVLIFTEYQQRNGRLDRHGQRAKQVLVHHFVMQSYDAERSQLQRAPGELEGDLEFLARMT